MDDVMDESLTSDECYGCDRKVYRLLDLEIQLVQIELYTTALERELEEKEELENESSPTISNPIPDDEDAKLKVGDRVRYVGKKYQESIGNQVMSVVKISVHWTGNQVTCSYDRGWTTWIPESSLKKNKARERP